MAHFAQLDENNTVLQVIVVNNQVLLDSNNNEQESLGIAFCQSLYGENTHWKQTSYNHNFRKRFASIGGTYDDVNDVFISPKPYESWILNDNYAWEAPVPYPTDDEDSHIWNEETQSWIEI